MPYFLWAIFFALLFTWLNLRGVETSARINGFLAAGMGIVIVIFVFEAVRYIYHLPYFGPGFAAARRSIYSNCSTPATRERCQRSTQARLAKPLPDLQAAFFRAESNFHVARLRVISPIL